MPRPSLLAILALAAGAVYANTQMGQQSEELSPQGQAAQAVFTDPLGSSPIGVGQGGPSLADALTVERRASLWFEYARDVSSIVSPTLLAPRCLQRVEKRSLQLRSCRHS